MDIVLKVVTMNKLIYADGAKATNLLNSDDPTVWTYFSGQPQASDIKLYARVAACYRAFNLKANTISSIPFAIVKGSEDYDTSANWENKVGFMPNPSELFRLGVLSYMATNTIYNLRTSDVLGYKTKDMIHAVAYNFEPITDPVTGELLRIERGVGVQKEEYKPDDPRLVRLWRLDHTTEVLPSPNTEAMAIMKSAGEIYYADTWVENFYRRGGIKPTLISMKGMVSPEKKEEEQKAWSQFLRGIGNWWNNIARVFNAEAMDVKAFGDGVADLDNNEVYKQAIANIAMGTGMPLSLLLANSANYSTAKEEKATWYDNDIIPFCNWLSYEYNRQVFEPLGMRLEFRPETIDVQQEDETQRAGAYYTYVEAGIKPSVAAQILGIEMPEGIEYEDLDKMKEEAQKEKQQNNPFGGSGVVKPQGGQIQSEKIETYKPPKKALSVNEYKELSVWRDVSLRRLKRGDSLVFEYEPHYGGLPDKIAKSIIEQLKNAEDEEQVKTIFNIDPEPQNDIIYLADAINNWANKAFQPST